MLKIKTCIYTVFILLNINTVYAVSFDCSKASRASEKAICSNVELSALDDELSTAYKKALLISPEIKSSQREWIQSTRLCESNTATLNSCIKSAYSNRISILTNRTIPANVARVEPLVKGAETKRNDSVAVNNVPVKSVQPSIGQTAQPVQQTITTLRVSASLAEQEVRKLIAAECKADKVMLKKNLSVIEAKATMDEFEKAGEEMKKRIQKLSQDQKDEFLIFFKVVRDQPEKCENPVFDRSILEVGKMYLRNN
ncbi:lysozyme inhibitor LprI family protein [Polaromonas sp.]|uniref:lysozyme inhibitor LprI family protein n=1 Tax=Polaromonas sp. TaxID=1869339 RepID=UPI0013B7F751|nr:lysozyme inhibitor LprI family protein [Polaromonas sp.]NDP63455.1 DUF1311 domain-containing protein [Polaromonas sp.]